jgi:hypothetical protein
MTDFIMASISVGRTLLSAAVGVDLDVALAFDLDVALALLFPLLFHHQPNLFPS